LTLLFKIPEKSTPSRLWNGYLFLIFWSAVFCAVVYRHELKRDEDVFVETRQRLMKHYAEDVSDALTVGDDVRLNNLLHRMAGEESGRYAFLAGSDGTGRQAGDRYFRGSPADDRLASQARLADRVLVLSEDGSDRMIELVSPVFVQKKRWGVLRWGVWTTSLEWRAHRILTAVLMMGVWFIVVSGVGVYWAEKKKKVPESERVP